MLTLPGSKLLYLGGASGTSVSHCSDLVGPEGAVYAVEFSHRSGRDLVNMAKQRPNVIPIIEDARHPQKYRMLVPMVDVVFADVAQVGGAVLGALRRLFAASCCGVCLCAGAHGGRGLCRRGTGGRCAFLGLKAWHLRLCTSAVLDQQGFAAVCFVPSCLAASIVQVLADIPCTAVLLWCWWRACYLRSCSRRQHTVLKTRATHTDMTFVCVLSHPQPDQARIVGLNAQYFLKNGGHYVISIKASCIDSTAQPEAVFAREIKKLQEMQLKPREQVGCCCCCLCSFVSFCLAMPCDCWLWHYQGWLLLLPLLLLSS